jgi:hypothetical protein
MGRRIRNAFDRFRFGAGSGDASGEIEPGGGDRYVVTEDEADDVTTEDGDLVDWGE